MMNPTRSNDDAAQKAKMAWWEEARYGMFIHWGLYAIPAGVWKGKLGGHPYAEHLLLAEKIPIKEWGKLADQFHGTNFDPHYWADVAVRAGMKYMILTSKHEEGFSMFDSQVSDFNVVKQTPYGRDVVRELADAARARGLKFGVYYSQARDYHHPLASWNDWGNKVDFPDTTEEDFNQYLREKAMPQVRELLTNYGELAVIWFDVPYKIDPNIAREIAELVYSLQPGCIINSRLGGEVWDYESMEDNEVSPEVMDRPWETCMTTNDSWGYHQRDCNWKTPRQILHSLIDIASKGGNLLLNVGPRSLGEIPPEAVELLTTVGDWLGRNGEAIYGTAHTGIGLPAWGRSTTRPGTTYLHLFDPPESGALKVDGITEKPAAVALLDGGRALDFKHEGSTLEITLPADAIDPLATVIQVNHA